jgi:hypothetical protein
VLRVYATLTEEQHRDKVRKSKRENEFAIGVCCRSAIVKMPKMHSVKQHQATTTVRQATMMISRRN